MEPVAAAAVGAIDPWNLPAMDIGIEAYISRSELCDDRAKALRSLSVGLKGLFSSDRPEQYNICNSMSLRPIEKQAFRVTTNISKANDLLTTLSRNIQCLL